MGGEVHLLFSLLVQLHLVQWMEALYMCFCVDVFFYHAVTAAIHHTALPCQQDKTVVVKQSKQSPLTAATSL